jgi:hypothetical protein
MQAIFTYERMYFILKLSSNSFLSRICIIFYGSHIIGNSYPSNSIVDLDLHFGQQWNFQDDNFQCNLELHAL